MSSVERFAVERSIRRAEYAHTLVAGVLVMLEQDIADLRGVLASDEASAALRIARSAETRRVSIPAQRKASSKRK
jgi:hypothetical protein